MYVKLCSLLPGLFLILFFISEVRAYEIRILTEELKPYNYLDESTGKPGGFSVDIVNLLLEETRIKAANNKIEIYPWARAYQIARKQKNTLVFTMARTAPRESLFKWVGPIAPRCIWLWKLKERKEIIVRSFEEAKKYSVGGPIGHAATQYVEESGFKVVYAPSPKFVTEMLSRHRIDLITGTDLIAAYSMKQLGRRFNELERLVKVDDRYEYYLALNIDTPEEIVRRLQEALDRIKADGQYDRIKKAYF